MFLKLNVPKTETFDDKPFCKDSTSMLAFITTCISANSTNFQKRKQFDHILH